MKREFDTRFGQELCDVLAAELGLVCSFMGDGGQIVASSVTERIGSVHAIAARIMRGEIDEYSVTRSEAAASGSMREGVNMGIDFDGQRLVCFAIAGPLEAVRPVANVVRFSVTSMLRARLEERGLAAGATRSSTTQTPAASPALTQAGARIGLGSMLAQVSETIESRLARLHDAIDTIDQGITVFDAGLRLVVWNRRFLAFAGLPPGALQFGETLTEVWRKWSTCAGYRSEHIQAMVEERAASALGTGVNRFEAQIPDGVLLEIVDSPLSGGGFVSTYTDVTRQRQSQVDLQAAYKKAEHLALARTRDLNDFAALSSDWFWEQDAEFRFTRFFGQSTDKLRRRQEDFFGKRRWDMPIGGVSEQTLARHIAVHERHEAFHNFEYQIPDATGKIQYFIISGVPMFDDAGGFSGYRGIGSNITELRLAEQAIRDRERHLAQIVAGSPIPTFVIDTEHRVTHWNPACSSLTGIPAQEVLGKSDAWRAFYETAQPTLADLVLTGSMDPALVGRYQKWGKSTTIDGAFEAEGYYRDLGQVEKWLFFTAAPLHDSNGNLTGAIETLQDITQRRRDRQLLQDHAEALQQAYQNMEERVVQRTAELSQQLHFQQQLIEAIPGPVFYKDEQARYLGFNSAFQAYIGRATSELVGKLPHDAFPKELADRYLAADRELLDAPGVQIYEGQARYASGELRDVMFHKATFTHPDGRVAGLVGVILDISERKRMEEKLRQAATVFDNSAEGVIVSDTDGNIITVNRAFTEITGYTEAEVIGRNPRMFQSGRHDRNFYRAMWNSISSKGRWQGEVWNRRKSGDVFPQWISVRAVHDAQGKLSNYVATFSDITLQKQTEERIQLLAFSDPLTGLPNRRLLMDRLQHALIVSSRSQRFGALFFIDLDDFKNLNDTRGHHVGDLLLKQVAARIESCVREGDTVARLGGDEFVVILEGLGDNAVETIGQAEMIGAKIMAALNQPYTLQERIHHNTPSIGVTLFGDQQSKLEELLKQADLAMYRAKSSGRNALRFFDPEMQLVVAARFAMDADLRQGFLQDQFVLYFQAQVDHRIQVTGAEALIRWNHPLRGMVSPGEFIPLAEETGLILPLGLWVLDTACRQLRIWSENAATAALTLAVNVSAHQFRQRDFVQLVLNTIETHGVNPGQLKLELTESLLLDDVEDIITKMTALKVRGVCFSLDDFGTGYSSLAYLKRLPLDQLKIDQSFVRDVLIDPNDAAIARTVVALAHSLGLNVIAEGVETQEQLEFLAAHGCHAYQGFLFSRPLALTEFEAYAATHS